MYTVNFQISKKYRFRKIKLRTPSFHILAKIISIDPAICYQTSNDGINYRINSENIIGFLSDRNTELIIIRISKWRLSSLGMPTVKFIIHRKLHWLDACYCTQIACSSFYLSIFCTQKCTSFQTQAIHDVGKIKSK